MAGHRATEAQNYAITIQDSGPEGPLPNPELPGTTTEKNKVYRVQGLPLRFDEEKTYDLISAIFNPESRNFEPEIRSLAESLDRKTKVAVIDFLETPAQLSIGDEWGFDIPDSHQDTDNSNKDKRYRRRKPKITIDNHFKGLTVLFSPLSEAHQVE